jgi:hypothetical protein
MNYIVLKNNKTSEVFYAMSARVRFENHETIAVTTSRMEAQQICESYQKEYTYTLDSDSDISVGTVKAVSKIKAVTEVLRGVVGCDYNSVKITII